MLTKVHLGGGKETVRENHRKFDQRENVDRAREEEQGAAQCQNVKKIRGQGEKKNHT